MKKKVDVRISVVKLLFLAVSLLVLSDIQAQNRMEKDAWKEATEGVDYGQEVKPEEQEEEQEADSSWTMPTVNPTVLNVIFISLIVIFLAFLIVKVMGNRIGFGKAKPSDNLSFSLEEIESNLHETDLERFQREALEKQDFKTAIRIFYLMIIQSLSEKGKINWKREKTNRHYLSEMRGNRSYKTFRDLTRSFEIVWYGEAPFSAEDYQKLYPTFSQYLKNLENREDDEK